MTAEIDKYCRLKKTLTSVNVHKIDFRCDWRMITLERYDCNHGRAQCPLRVILWRQNIFHTNVQSLKTHGVRSSRSFFWNSVFEHLIVTYRSSSLTICQVSITFQTRQRILATSHNNWKSIIKNLEYIPAKKNGRENRNSLAFMRPNKEIGCKFHSNGKPCVVAMTYVTWVIHYYCSYVICMSKNLIN